jgi:hypothetical protein
MGIRITSIEIPYEWESVNSENDNVDVFVTVQDGYTYILSVATLKNIESLMNEKGQNYYGPEYPFIIVKQITKEVIEEAISAYAEQDNGYWLQMYHFAGSENYIKQPIFDELKAQSIERIKKREELLKQYDDELDDSTES